MALESGTWVGDLITTNPLSTDDKRQGDDHLRLIKGVLKNTFLRATKAWALPGNVTKNSNYTMLATDNNLVFTVDTTAAPITLTLPTLTAADDGWKVDVVKVGTNANPIFIQPASGSINQIGSGSFAKVRRTAEYGITKFVWNGNAWIANRPITAPIGTVFEYYGFTLPNGFLWADGGTFVATDFVELNVIFGVNTKPDLRGRASIGRDDMGGAAAGRVTSGGSGIAGTALRAAGGSEIVGLSTAQLAAHSHPVSGTHSHGPGTLTTDTQGTHQHSAFIRDPNHTHNFPANTNNTGVGAGSVVNCVSNSNIQITSLQNVTGVRVNSGVGGSGTDDLVASAGAHAHSVTIGSTAAVSSGPTDSVGSGVAHQNMPPALVCNKIIVAE